VSYLNYKESRNMDLDGKYIYKNAEWISEEVYLAADAAAVRFSSLRAPFFRGDAELAL
jgi:hypothetical protein